MALLRLPAPALRGTFAKAYALLARLVSQIGWDELLRARSNVFVMEEEYRAQKANQASPSTNVGPAIHGTDADDSASTQGIAPDDSDEPLRPATSTPPQESSLESDSENEGDQANGLTAEEKRQSKLGINSAANASSQSIPTIKISTESDHEREKLELEEYMKSLKDGEGSRDNSSAGTDAGETVRASVQIDPPPLEKPAQASAGHERTDSASVSGSPADLSGRKETGTKEPIVNGEHDASIAEALAKQTAGLSLTAKRLCERWLDNLFMVLYEVRLLVLTLSCLSMTLKLMNLGVDRTCACTRSGGPRLHTTAIRTFPTERQVRNGRFSASWRSDCTTRTRPRMLSSDAWMPSLAPRPICVCSRCTRSSRTSSAACGLHCGSRRTTTGGTWKDR